LKVNTRINYLFLFASISFLCQGQHFVTREFLQAVDKGTRTLSGVPGVNYFQNSSDYVMEVNFDPGTGRLEGKASIEYRNNSNDTLRHLIVRLYQNINKKGGIRDHEVDPEVIHNGVEIQSLMVDGKELATGRRIYLRESGTNLRVSLPFPLLPQSSKILKVAWSFDMPQSAMRRYGKYGENHYFIAYWYPQVAVYDDLFGWDELNYTGTQEFYNDFSNFDVKIKVPGNYLVWAGAEWQNPSEVLSPEHYERLLRAKQTDEKVSILGADEVKNQSWRVNRKTQSYHFTSANTPDFAFAVSDGYVWDATSVLIDSASGKRVLVQAVYKPGADFFDIVAESGRDAIHHFSFTSYGEPYPYPVVTVFQGEGGMEFPMMANNSSRQSWSATVFLTIHELAHAYFPFMTGINERRHGWFDEGLTTYLPMETEEALQSYYYTIELVIRNYILHAGSENDIPPYIPSSQTRDEAYLYTTYFRSTVAFYLLEQYMGRESFRAAVNDFIDTWKFKHPTPYDFFATLKKHSESDLAWFIDAWFFRSGWPDLAIGEVKMTDNTLRVEILRKGSMPVPVELTIRYRENEEERISYSPEVWKDSDRLIITHPVVDEMES
jgi:hypothetical protein